jgi:hypothetical protein
MANGTGVGLGSLGIFAGCPEIKKCSHFRVIVFAEGYKRLQKVEDWARAAGVAQIEYRHLHKD